MDASVVLKWFLPELDSPAADILLEKFLNNEAELIAPDLLLLEVASALWKRVVLRKELSTDEANLIYRDLLTLPLPLSPSGPLLETAFQWAMKLGHSVYDVLYCALAAERGCDFVTADQALANKLGRAVPFISHVSTIKP